MPRGRPACRTPARLRLRAQRHQNRLGAAAGGLPTLRHAAGGRVQARVFPPAAGRGQPQHLGGLWQRRRPGASLRQLRAAVWVGSARRCPAASSPPTLAASLLLLEGSAVLPLLRPTALPCQHGAPALRVYNWLSHIDLLGLFSEQRASRVRSYLPWRRLTRSSQAPPMPSHLPISAYIAHLSYCPATSVQHCRASRQRVGIRDCSAG